MLSSDFTWTSWNHRKFPWHISIWNVDTLCLWHEFENNQLFKSSPLEIWSWKRQLFGGRKILRKLNLISVCFQSKQTNKIVVYDKRWLDKEELDFISFNFFLPRQNQYSREVLYKVDQAWLATFCFLMCQIERLKWLRYSGIDNKQIENYRVTSNPYHKSSVQIKDVTNEKKL